jgi:hypothetical protein
MIRPCWSALLCCFFVALAHALPLAAREIFVDNTTGNDRNIGTSATNSSLGGGPCRSITRALAVAQESDQIVVANTGVPYRESLTLFGMRNSGSPKFPFVIIGNGAVLDGSVPVNPRGWQYFDNDIFRLTPTRTSYQQLFLEGVPLQRVHLDNNNLQLPTLRPFQWCMFERQIYLCMKQPTEDDLAFAASTGDEFLQQLYTREPWKYSPGEYDFSIAGLPVGITLYDVRNVVITDLFVQGYQLDGINAHDKAFAVELLGVTTRGNGRSGISIGGASRVKIAESSSRYNGAAQIRTEGFSHTIIVDSELLGATAPPLVREGGDVTINGLIVDQTELKNDVLPPAAPPAK